MYKKIIFQHDERDCGAACLASISKFYNLKMPLSFFRNICKTDISGTNLYGLVAAAQNIGYIADALEGTSSELLSGIETGEIHFPFIAHIINENGLAHYIVIWSARKSTLLIGDPEFGEKRITYDKFFSMWSGYIITLTPGNHFLSQIKYEKTTGFLLSLLKGQYSKLLFAAVLSLFIAIIGILGAFIFQIIVDEFNVGNLHDNAANKNLSIMSHIDENVAIFLEHFLGIRFSNLIILKITVLVMSFVMLYLLQAFIQLLRGQIILRVAQNIDTKLTVSYYNHIQSLRIENTRTIQTGDYLSRLSDAQVIRDTISTIMVTLFLDIVLIIGCSFVLYNENCIMFGISFILMFLYAILAWIYKKPIKKANRQVMAKNAKMQSYVKETIDGIETIRASSAVDLVKTTANNLINDFIGSSISSSFLALTQDVIATTLELVGVVIIMGLGFTLVSTGVLSIGAVMTFYALLGYFTTPVKNIISLQADIQEAMVAVERIKDIVDMPIEETTSQQKMPAIIKKWEVNCVKFRYGYRKMTLNNVSIAVNRGEKIAIVGTSGSGKSTLAKLFLRFYEPESGSITADNIELFNYDIISLRQNIAYVSQDTFFLTDTLMNNITLGLDNYSLEEVTSICQKCCLDTWIDSLPLGINTPIEENGGNLSGGQKQRIAIVRALLKHPQLLILDEATSNLDTVTETTIKNLLNSYKDISIIIIAHRLSTIKECNRIYVLNEGEVVEEGSHSELLKQKKYYYNLWKNQ